MSSVETVNAAATAIVTAESRVQPSTVQKRRWASCWSLYWCFGSYKNSKRIGHAVLVPESAVPGAVPSVADSLNHSASIVIPFIAPPSSPASFLQSDPPSATHSPAAGLLSLTSLSVNSYSPGGTASIFAIGPYAYETQLVSPPVFSAFTTEPSTACFTPPPESVQLTTPSSPEVPFAQLLTSSLAQNRRNSGSNLKFPLSQYEFQPESETVPLTRGGKTISQAAPPLRRGGEGRDAVRAGGRGMKDGRAGGKQPSVDERYTQWKSLVPVLYDWLANHNLVWPSLSCRWGPQLEQATYKNRQRLYLSEQTDGSVPNTLVIANCEIVKPRVAAAEHISQFNEEARSPFVKKFKTIIHPGEVNRIRELPQDSKIVATHTDSPDVLIWDVESQPNRHALLGATESRPDLILTGHQDNAEFALAMCPIEPFVLSGGKDKSVVLWSIHDHISSLASNQGAQKSPGSGPGASNTKTPKVDEVDHKANSPTVHARGVFQGHEDTVEDVQFCPSSAQEFCSVGDDSCLILWDARTGSAPVIKVEKAHSADLHCVDWNPHDVNLILTGSADNSVKMFDRRSLTSGGVGTPIHTFEGHTAAVLCVQWSPDKSSVFGSSAEDGILNLWDYDKIGKLEHAGTKAPNSSPALFFRHAGHRDKVVDFHWNASDPWTIVSVSDDGESTGGGGTLQIWRMIDLIYRPEEEVIEELDKFKSHLSTCSP